MVSIIVVFISTYGLHCFSRPFCQVTGIGRTFNFEYLPRPLCVIEKLIFLFLNQNIFCGYSKEPSQWDGSFECHIHMLKLKDKKYMYQYFHAPIFFLYVDLCYWIPKFLTLSPAPSSFKARWYSFIDLFSLAIFVAHFLASLSKWWAALLSCLSRPMVWPFCQVTGVGRNLWTF